MLIVGSLPHDRLGGSCHYRIDGSNRADNPILLSVVSSKFVADLLMPDPLYERLIAAMGVRYLPPHDDPAVIKKLENKQVRDCASHTVVVVREVEERERIGTALNRTGLQIFPFVTDGGNVVGTDSSFAKEKHRC